MVLLAINVELAADLHAERSELIAARIAELGLFTIVLLSALAAASYFFGAQALALWTGRVGLFDANLLLWLFAGALANALAAPFQMLFAFANEPRTVALAGLVNAAVGLPLAGLGALRHGAPGLACGLALGEIAASVFTLGWRVRGRLAVDPLRYAARCLAAGTLTALWCAAVAHGIAHGIEALPPIAGAFGLALRLAAFGALGPLPALVLATPRQIRGRLREAASARMKKRPYQAAGRKTRFL